jgi:hypothetical protein
MTPAVLGVNAFVGVITPAGLAAARGSAAWCLPGRV